jgi:hypothetical protein
LRIGLVDQQRKNREAEADAVAIRMRATRRLDQLRQAQKDKIGLAKGGQPYQRRKPTGLADNPVATLAMQGIDKNLAHQARVLRSAVGCRLRAQGGRTRAPAARVFRRAVREVEIAQEREERRARTALGGSVADLNALIASGFRAGSIAVDPPWPFEQYSDRAARAIFEQYETIVARPDQGAAGRAARPTIARCFCGLRGPSCRSGTRSSRHGASPTAGLPSIG